ncbi:MAG: hypothetical protein AAF531_10870, partial [Actinomycetota bacterium]
MSTVNQQGTASPGSTTQQDSIDRSGSAGRTRRATGAGRRMAAVVAALALGATACVSSAGRDEAAPPATDLSGDEIQLTSALETVDSCDALLDR